MNFLTEILEVKKTEVKKLRNKFTFSSFTDFPYWESETLPFRNKLLSNDGMKVIAEIKKASPSKGLLLEDFNHIKIAEEYMSAGADAISVLTDKLFFQGDISFLNDIAKIKDVPLLRKDFIIDEYQIFEAKANGADIVLLISEALSQLQLNDLTDAALELGLNVLVELHGEEQLNKIDVKRSIILGINNRDLHTFNVDLHTTLELRKLIPDNVPVISESGIKTEDDIKLLKGNDISGVLVGESLMKADNRKEKLKELKHWLQDES